jgi:hypothetical protein
MKRFAAGIAILLCLLGCPALAAFNKVETFPFSNISANTAAFTLRGGNYGLTCHATWGGGSVTLQRLATDASTYVTVVTALTADGYASANLPSGTYRLTVATATAVYCDVTATVTTQ